MRKRRALVIGSGMDVLDKKRGEFIDEYFDEIIVVKYAVRHLDADYMGCPTILLAPTKEWYKTAYAEIIDEDMKELFLKWHADFDREQYFDDFYRCLANTDITKIWRYSIDCNKELCYDMRVPYPIQIQPINMGRTTAGLNAIHQALAEGWDVHYMGFDGGLRGVHFYQDVEHTCWPWHDPHKRTDPHQYFEIKNLERAGKIAHIDSLLF